jgi:putative flippase GtrA
MITNTETRLPIIVRFMRHRFLKFGTIGFLGTLVNLCIFSINQEFILKNIYPAAVRLNASLACAIFAATVHNFFWNRSWTWRDRRKKIKKILLLQMGQYFVASWFAITLQFVFTNAFALVLHYLLANSIAIMISALINYFINDRWTFSVKKRNRGEA